MEDVELTLENSVRESLSDALSQLVRLLAKAVSEAHDVCDVTYALHCLAFLLFPHCFKKNADSGALAMDVAEQASKCHEKALEVSSNGDWRRVLKSVFYQGSLFPVLANILLFSVAPDWLACFSSAEQAHLFDAFFMLAPATLMIKELVSALAPAYDKVKCDFPVETTLSSKAIERLLVIHLFENDGIKKIAMEFAKKSKSEGLVSRTDQSVKVVAQVVASVPDKARREAPASLLLPQFHLFATRSALQAAEEYWLSNLGNSDIFRGPLRFTAELCARFCRRGHADVVASQILFKLGNNLEQCDLGNTRGSSEEFGFWTVIMDSMGDIYALERLVRELLLEMSKKQIKDSDAYCILCLLFSKLIECRNNIRLLFTEKVLYWTNVPFRCLRWILYFAVFFCPPVEAASSSFIRFSLDESQIDIIKHLVDVWAAERFIQSAEIQKHSHMTAAICLSLSVMTKEDLENSQDFLRLLLQGISRRLESPVQLVRLMAKKVALAFSLVVDPANPLLLDEDDKVEDLADWEVLDTYGSSTVTEDNFDVRNEGKSKSADTVNGTKKVKKDKGVSEAYDPDEVVDLRAYRFSDDDGSDESDSESECSLKPYDLSDDESDLYKGKYPAQLRDCSADLRKGDQPDVVEKALEVVEKLVRAVPEELENAAPDLAHALIHVRCSDVAVEGQESSAEKRRYDALVALLACAPLSVEVFTQTLYSPHVDVSQRILILDVMSDAAREIALSDADRSEALSPNWHQITEIDKTWYGPGGYTRIGAGPWKEVSERNAMVSLTHKFERELPLRQESSQALGKSRRWGHRSMQIRREQHSQARHNSRKNNFVAYAPSFMLPVMRDYDKQQHGVDLIGRDFIVLGRLICMLGVCMECVSLHPEACILAGGLLSMLRSKHISGHPEVYVRRATLYAVSRVMISLHPSHVKNAISGGDVEIGTGLEWIRRWAIEVAENDTDQECSSMAMACLHIHSELVLQASRLAEPQHAQGFSHRAPRNTLKLNRHTVPLAELVNIRSTFSFLRVFFFSVYCDRGLSRMRSMQSLSCNRLAGDASVVDPYNSVLSTHVAVADPPLSKAKYAQLEYVIARFQRKHFEDIGQRHVESGAKENAVYALEYDVKKMQLLQPPGKGNCDKRRPTGARGKAREQHRHRVVQPRGRSEGRAFWSVDVERGYSRVSRLLI
ncbi:hypothetical protein GOP47_0000013 [Adiantum capillus-veneris]|uniref:Telomere length regulation protein conserved domain-containing protein n=1 Tax=Adiantum capillus-veneris TaxID=13818 RepID=A0A9D4ZQ63_ADICA|nr:hypothetical protein GOP47_0000013 [Adiantum capillus-veneris]